MPLHDICTALGNKPIQCLPAFHGMSGCDTASNIPTKLAALNESYPQDFISDPQVYQFEAERKHDADGRNIPDEVSQAKNRSGHI